jgi:hypothetical protein
LFQGNPLPLDFSWKANNSEYKVRKSLKNDFINARLAFYSGFSILLMKKNEPGKDDFMRYLCRK